MNGIYAINYRDLGKETDGRRNPVRETRELTLHNGR